MNRRAVMIPYVGRVVLLTSLGAHAYALVLMLASMQHYARPGVVAAAWCLSAAVPPATVLLSRRTHDRLSDRATAVVVIGILAVDIAVMASMAPAERTGFANWAIGALALTILGLAAYRPVREILVLGLLHGIVVGVGSAAAGVPDADHAASIVIVVVVAILPSVAAAGFLAAYADVLRLRQATARRHVEAEAGNRTDEALAVERGRRVERLRRELLPLLDEVADGRVPLPLDERCSARARELSTSLRRELVAARTGTWLTEALTRFPAGHRVEVVDGQRLAERLDEEARTALIAAVVALASALPSSLVTVIAGIDEAEGSYWAMTARGRDAARAARDIRVRAAMGHIGAAVTVEGPERLIVELRCAIAAVTRPARA